MSDDINLRSTDGGVLLPVHAQPKASRNGIVGVHDGGLKVSVTQAPEKGKANTAFIKTLAKSLGLRKSQIQLVSGETNRSKTFLITDITAEELRSLIASICPD
ncbi:DUF167 domain-containing protein [Thalassoroseus pseudoceratinae]|uniref:DUF167 domain-containing protein n=1 Tax=Thalassoroseus pseudoceratinae TaxID=2713176 RepID=UPI00141F4089|nr:DUF167 domain-containing protein [Thalassoroseus pseudoceratinae]